MKKFVWILLCAALLLAGCNSEQPTVTTTLPVETTTEATTLPVETTVPVPDTASATALTDKTCVLIATLERGATVQVVGEHEEDYYIVKNGESYGLVEKRLVRLAGEEAYAQWTGYAQSNVKFYDNYYLQGEPVQSLGMNTQVRVLEDVGACLVVQYGETVGYMRAKDVSKNYIQPSPSGGSADGGDISLSAKVILLASLVPQEGEVTGEGTALVEGVEIILGWFDRGEEISVITESGYAEEKEGWVAVYFEGTCGYVRQAYLRKEGQEAFTAWDGYATYNAPLYDNYYLNGEPVQKLPANGKIQIVEDLGSCYLVVYGEVTGYLAKDNASESYINYGGGSSGGDWTPPAL